ncbi:hypothetical protein SD81_038840 [Tolypothrix campylonemoides VB511288]|nr:hypothetical protein SD81_038840 [Tolypothrix campylonemoides VB511288]
MASTPSPWRPGLVECIGVRIARMRQWEFWPAWLFYVPVVAWILVQAVRTRRPTAFTATNPLMDHGGVVGERKAVALRALAAARPERVAAFAVVPAGDVDDEAIDRVVDALGGLPLAVKPDIGQRGRGVRIVRDRAALAATLRSMPGDRLVQRYVGGEEYGVFVVRDPRDGAVRVTSIVHKRFPAVRGDGARTLRRLIHDDARARLIAPLLARTLGDRLDAVPAAGTHVPLVQLGSHCRGAVFEDACALAGPGLQAAMQDVLDALPGFHYGRFDLRCPDAAHLARGEALQVLELNGVTAEPAHVYHPGASLWRAWVAFCAHWRIAYDIGAANARAGVPTTSAFTLLRLFRDDLRRGAAFD